jgi:hypothetical protein
MPLKGFVSVVISTGVGFSALTSSKFVQPKNTPDFPKVVNLAGSSMDFNEVQFLNAHALMFVSVFGSTRDSRELQLWNAPFPMLVIPSGRLMLLRAEHP